MLDSDRHACTHAHDLLSNDIILEILSQLDAERDNSLTPWHYTGTNLQPTLFALCLVDKRWNDGATRLLYKDVFIVGSVPLSQFARTLQERQHLRDYVRSFFCTSTCDEAGEGRSSLFNPPDIRQVYSLCRNLRCERLLYKPDRLQSDNTRMLDAHWKQLGAGAITCLELRFFDRSLAGLFKSDVSFPVLEDLIIRGSQFGDESIAGIQWSVMPRLRRLCLNQCVFSGEHISLPLSLRALEIVGGHYTIKNLEDDIVSIGKSLELLTFMPMHFQTQQRIAPLNKWLRELPLVITLRVAASLFSPMYPVSLPPRLQHLVVTKTSAISLEGFLAAQEWVSRQVESGNSGMTASHLRTVRFIASDVVSNEFVKKEIGEEAERAGIRFSVTHKEIDIFFDNVFRGWDDFGIIRGFP